MRRRATLRRSRLMRATAGATILAAPTSAALAAAPHAAPTLEAQLNTHRLDYGQAVVVTGRAPASDAGETAALEFTPRASSTWQQIASTTIGSDGRFRLRTPVRSSGSVMVLTGSTATSSPVPVAAPATASSTAPERVEVAAALRIPWRQRDVLGAQAIDVRGELLPRAAGHRVLLQGRAGRRWITLARARTGAHGRFELHYRVTVPGVQALRVRFAGDRRNSATSARAGTLAMLQPSVASWYDDAGNTACGFHAYYGVANLSLPCGSSVSLSYGGRTVNAVVDDRGPYVGGREWDLNQNTAAALGFAGVGTVWSSR